MDKPLKSSGMDRKSLLIAFLAVLLVACLAYIGWTKFAEERITAFSGGYQQGYSAGVRDTVYTLLQQTDGCKPTDVNFGNYTRSVVDVACLKLAENS